MMCYSNDFFRLSRKTFQTILEKISPYDEFRVVNEGGRKPLSIEKQLLITLWYLGSKDTTLQIADRFGVTEFSVIQSRRRIVNVIHRYLKSKIITWPDANEIQLVKDHFEMKCGFPNVVGALDGTHIKIPSPSNNHEKYINRKGFHSIQLQAVCREDTRFIDCYGGWPGSVHDARVFRNSDLFDNGPTLCGDGHILADSAYPLKPWVLTPYRDNGHLTPEQRFFNKCQSSTRVVIERAFGLLKTRFRRLGYLNIKDIQETSDTIIVCCVIHNVCVLSADFLEEMLAEDDENDVGFHGPHVQDNAGTLKRNRIAAVLFRDRAQ